jgi:hypothetical protein
MTRKPLHIYVEPEMLDWEEVRALAQVGHRVTVLPSEIQGDMILSPRAYRITRATARYIDTVVRAVQRATPPRKGAAT